MDSLPINVTDLIIIIVIVISGLFSFLRGLVHEVLAVGSWVGATFVTLYSFPYATELASQIISVKLIAEWTAGVVTFIVALVVFSLITRLLARQVQQSGLGPLDRTLGLLFGFVRGAVLVCLAWMVLALFIPREDWPESVQEAKTLPLVAAGSSVLLSLAPADLAVRTQETLDLVKDRAGQVEDLNKAFDDLNSALPKNGATGQEPEYNNDMRGALQRAIEDLSDESEADGATDQ
ncbi:MAG: CvpA family protein [Pseudomonadota bacterium]